MRMRGWIGALAAVGCVGFAPVTHATNGYFSHGYGTVAKGMAGAGAAMAIDLMAPATNPAAAVFLDPGIDVGIGIFSPDREYRVAGPPSGLPGTFGLAPGAVRSGARAFAIPHAGLARRLGSHAALGFAMYGNGGMNTSYDAATFGVAPAGVDLSQMFIAPTYARRLGGRHAVGVTGLIGYQRFEAKGLDAFGGFSTRPGALTGLDHSNSFGGGLRVGYLGRWTDRVSVGAAYQTRIWMSEFDEYEGLFAGSGDFDIPSNWVLGVAVTPIDRLDVAVDVQQVRYSEIDAIGNHLLPNLGQARLGADEGAGFGWADMTTLKIGTQLRAGRGVTWRGGYSYGRQPIPESEVLFNILAPGVMEQHGTFGVSKELAPGKSLNLAVMHAFTKSVTGPNPLEVPGLQEITLQMKQWEFELSYSIRF
jgi:long-chain fatty acid transport protein